MYYLPPAAFKGLLASISETATIGSRLYFDFINLSTMSGARLVTRGHGLLSVGPRPLAGDACVHALCVLLAVHAIPHPWSGGAQVAAASSLASTTSPP